MAENKKYLDMPGLTYFYNQIKSKFASKTDVSTPLTASTIAAMTDHDKVYVYTGSETGHTFGDWYYYEDGSWHSAGQYRANVYETDKTLSVADKPADGKKTGDEIADLKSALNVKTPIQYIADHWVDFRTEPVEIVNLPASTNPGEKCAIISCSEGDKFIINAVGGRFGRAWGFLDANNMVLSMAEENATVENLELTAPANATTLVINDHNDLTSYKITGFVTDVVDKLENEKIDKQQLTSHAGKALVIGMDGIIRPEKMLAGLSDNAKRALLSCFRHVAFLDGNDGYYKALVSALDEDSYPKLEVIYDPGVNIVGTEDSLDSIKAYLTIRYFETNISAGVLLSSNDYTITGALNAGDSIISVNYNNVSELLVIPDVVDFYNTWTWTWSNNGGNLTKLHASVDGDLTDTTSYPSTMAILNPYEQRRHYCVTKGMAPYYVMNQTAVPSQYYPIPIPDGAGHVRVTLLPEGQYIYLCAYQINNNLQYTPRVNRTAWTQLTNGVFERGITGVGRRFLTLNTKYDDAGNSYPVEPTSMIIEFS